MITSGWAVFALSLFIAICGVIASIAVAQYRINKTDQALISLEAAIRDVGREIKGFLFNSQDAGRPFYRRVDDCEKTYEELIERILLLEAKSHTHELTRKNQEAS